MTESSLEARVVRILASTRLVSQKPPEGPSTWDLEIAEPADVAALFDRVGALELDDRTRLLARSEMARATSWLVEEKALTWPRDVVVIGERDDLVIALDLDVDDARAGGGVLEAATDGLESFRRVALDVVGYLEWRLGWIDAAHLAPEEAARRGLEASDAGALEAAIARPFYPGGEADLSRAAMRLGELCAIEGKERDAFAAFEVAASARARGARRGAKANAFADAMKAAATLSEKAGAHALAAACRAARYEEPPARTKNG